MSSLDVECAHEPKHVPSEVINAHRCNLCWRRNRLPAKAVSAQASESTIFVSVVFR
jgi:hypothetical protein